MQGPGLRGPSAPASLGAVPRHLCGPAPQTVFGQLPSHLFPRGSVVKNLPAKQETRVQSLGWKEPLKKEMATLSSNLAWKIPWTEEPGRLHTVHGVTELDTT